MSRVKTSLDHKRIRCLISLVLTVFVLLGYSLQSVAGSAYYSMVMRAYGTVSSPPVILQNGTAGSSIIYTNETSAKVNVAAPPGIAFDAVGSGNNGGGLTSVSWSHTTGSGSNRLMFVGVSIRTTTVSVSSITYGAQSLIFIRADTHASATIRSELWYLIAPASGTATVTVTLTGTSRATGGSCTYTGVAQASPIDVNGGGTGTSNSPSKSVTVNTTNSWLLGHLAITGSAKTVSSEGSGQTMRWDQVTSGGTAPERNRGHGSNKGPVGTGSRTMSWTLSGPEDWAVSVVAFKPATSTYDHVLKVVNNQVTNNSKIKLKVYGNSSIGRLSSLNISLYDGASSNQIAITNGSIVKSEGAWYDLPAGLGSTVKISMTNLQATTTGTSYLYVYLKILVPNTSTYILYVITFEIT